MHRLVEITGIMRGDTKADNGRMTEPVAESTCPTCGLPGVPLMFGLPVDAARDAASAGEIALAGCLQPDDPPNWADSRRHQWRDAADQSGWDARLMQALVAHGYEH